MEKTIETYIMETVSKEPIKGILHIFLIMNNVLKYTNDFFETALRRHAWEMKSWGFGLPKRGSQSDTK